MALEELWPARTLPEPSGLLGFLHRPHPAFAQLVENHVVANAQATSLLLVDGLAGVEPGEFALSAEFLGKILGCLEAMVQGQGIEQGLDVVRVHQARGRDRLDELSERDRHDRPFSGRHSNCPFG